MDREWKQVLIVIGIVAILILGGYVGIKAYSGMDNSLTVVVSGSMEHSDKSTVGIIDTGDMIVMKNKDKGITTYVEGYNNGHSTFGEYGDVIIYNRDSGNPVIHRAIVWIDYKNGIYSAPSLNEKDYGKLWKTDTGNKDNFNWISFYLPNHGGPDNLWYSFSMKNAGEVSGYLTKGDNNNGFDPHSIGYLNSLVTYDMVKAVAGLEIPWLGAIKLYINGNTSDIQSNTLCCLIFEILDILAFLVVISILWDYIDRRLYQQ